MEINRVENYRQYLDLYRYSIKNPKAFWDQCATDYIDWFCLYDNVYSGDISSFDQDNSEKWFANGKLNACYNCIDRHLEDNPDKVAYYWQGDEWNHTQSVTYHELFDRVCLFANVLKKIGIKKGDRVCIYLPTSIEAITAMLACARIGAVHTVVFAGFSAQALAQRILDAECKLLITTDRSVRGGKNIDLWDFANNALDLINSSTNSNSAVKPSVLMVENYYSDEAKLKDITNIRTSSQHNTCLYDYNKFSHEQVGMDKFCPPTWMDAEDPLFILYTSGSTGKPKGVMHTTAGYLLHCSYSFDIILNPKSSDIYWSTADIGWVAGHSYVVYGALSNGITSVIYSGTPIYPSPDIFWKIIDQYKVSIFYTAPTAIRALMKQGDNYLNTSDRSSLRLLATVGEPINSESWQWYFEKVGSSKCPIIDTWWQTETGAVMLSPYPSLDISKPGCAMLPFMGIQLAILNEDGSEIHPDNKSSADIKGSLVIKSPWPGMARTVYNDHEKYLDTYFKPYNGYFYTGDIAKIDSEEHYWLLGRGDDVINIAGHRLSTSEVEGAVLSHDAVVEAAAIAIDDEVKGQVLAIFAVLSEHMLDNSYDIIEAVIKNHVREVIGPIAIIKSVTIIAELPKTRSGKIMRRILKNVAQGSKEFGDVSTLMNPEVLKELV